MLVLMNQFADRKDGVREQKRRVLALMNQLFARKDRVLLMWCCAARFDVETATEVAEGRSTAADKLSEPRMENDESNEC